MNTPGSDLRVVSLVPSATETLSAWGLEPVACTRFCERPDLPHVGGTKDPDVEAIVESAPDLVVVDVEENRREDAEALTAAGVPLEVLHVTSIDTAQRELDRLAERLGLDARFQVPHGRRRRRAQAVVPIWRRPWMVLGPRTYGADLLRHLGISVVALSGAYPEVSESEWRTLGADVVIVPDEPYPFSERHRRELEEGGRVVFVDGRDLLWWGARTPDAARRLAVRLDEAGVA